MNAAITSEFRSLVGPRNVLSSPEDLAMYEYDGSVDRARPEIVVFPSSTAEVSQIVKLAVKHDIPIVGRGAGTGLSGGALARGGGIMIAFGRMNRILEIDLENRRAVVQP
jgi:glycolate oxidase